MQTRLKMSRDGLELLKEFEGLRLVAAQLPDGRWTVGHGHTQYAREGASISISDAEDLLVYDLIPVVAAVNEAVVPQISQNQFDALVCFAFNVGVEEFRTSEVLQRVNQERITEAALAMAIWRAGAFGGRRIVLDALVRRRTAEEAMLLGREGAQSPSNLVRPVVDETAQASLPESKPELIVVDNEGDAAAVHFVESDERNRATEAPTIVPFSHVLEKEAVEDPEALARPVDGDESSSEDNITVGAPLETKIEIAPVATTIVTSATVSTRVEISYPERFSPAVARPVDRDNQGPAGAAALVSDEAPVDVVNEPLIDDPFEPPQVLILTPPPEVRAEPTPAQETTDIVQVETGALPEAQTPLFEDEAAGTSSDGEPVIYYESPALEGEGAARWSDTGAYVATGAVGLAAFGFGIAGFHLAGQDAIPAGMFDEKTIISWVLVAIGVICVWISAYNLFKRLGGPEPA